MRKPRAFSYPLTFGFLGVVAAVLTLEHYMGASAPVDVPDLRGSVYEPIEWSGSPEFKAYTPRKSDFI